MTHLCTKRPYSRGPQSKYVVGTPVGKFTVVELVAPEPYTWVKLACPCGRVFAAHKHHLNYHAKQVSCQNKCPLNWREKYRTSLTSTQNAVTLSEP
jgi:16S rRNA C1402 (ribose-2'-O) methylase RsmI